jgi:hypothetical protein
LETRNGGYVFHINPRFHLVQIVRNTDPYGNDEWGHEEKHGPFIFQNGQPFELIISVNYDRYHVNGSKQNCLKLFINFNIIIKGYYQWNTRI